MSVRSRSWESLPAVRKNSETHQAQDASVDAKSWKWPPSEEERNPLRGFARRGAGSVRAAVVMRLRGPGAVVVG